MLSYFPSQSFLCKQWRCLWNRLYLIGAPLRADAITLSGRPDRPQEAALRSLPGHLPLCGAGSEHSSSEP